MSSNNPIFNKISTEHPEFNSKTTIFPREFLIHHNRISDEERLRLELAGYYFFKKLSDKGDD